MPTIPPLPEISPADRVYARTSWADPGFMLTANDVESQEITLGATNSQLLAAPDPKRWAIGFSTRLAVIAPLLISPFNDFDNGFFGPAANFATNWFTIFNYGPIVCGEWYVQSGGVNHVRVTVLKISI